MSSGEGSTERVQFSSGGRIPRSLRGRSGRTTVPDRQAGSAGLSGAPLPETPARPPSRKPGQSAEPETERQPQPQSEFDTGLETGQEPEPGTGTGRGKVAAGIARGALIIAVLTTCSRILGLLRTVVFSQTVGSGCLGTAYVTANQVPNLIYELAIGGALTVAMVPVLARSAARSSADPAAKAPRRADLVGAAHLVGRDPAAAHRGHRRGRAPHRRAAEPGQPERRLPARRHDQRDQPTCWSSFAPQILLYGFSVVLFGLLQAYRRFTAYSLAPVLANVVTITSYLVFASLDHGAPLARTPLAAELVLCHRHHAEHRHARRRLDTGDLAAPAAAAAHAAGSRPACCAGRAASPWSALLEFVAGDIYSVVTIDAGQRPRRHRRPCPVQLRDRWSSPRSAPCSRSRS